MPVRVEQKHHIDYIMQNGTRIARTRLLRIEEGTSQVCTIWFFQRMKSIASTDKGLEVDQHNEDHKHDKISEGCTRLRFSTLMDWQHNLPLQ